MRCPQFLLFFLILLCQCDSSKGLSQSESNSTYDLKFIDFLFEKYAGKQPGASVVVIKDGQIEFSKSYGLSDMEHNIRATTKTNYRIASVSKQFTAMAIMILVQRNKLSYDSKLTEIFPKFPEFGKDITIRHLLTHRSGLVKYNRFIDPSSTEQMSDKDVLQGLLGVDETYFSPNSKYAYSNTGYAVLAQVIEKVSGKTFAEFMKNEIFLPLKMHNSVILEKGKQIKNRAYGYIVKDTSVIAKDQSRTSAIQGDGGVYTSVSEYYKWDKALYSSKLIPQNALDHAFYNYDENGKSSLDGYGYGWFVSYYNGIKILQHGGSSTGFGSHVIRIPSEGISVALFTNRNKRGQELSNRAKALISHFTNGKFQMPFEIVLEQEIESNGIENGIKLYHQIKKNTLHYNVSMEALFNFAIAYINENKSNEALQLFSVLKADYPEYFGGYYGSALIFKEENKKDKAIQNLKKVIEFAREKEQWAVEQATTLIKELELQKSQRK